MEQLILKIKQPQKLPFIKEMLAAFDEYVEIQEPVKIKKLKPNNILCLKAFSRD